MYVYGRMLWGTAVGSARPRRSVWDQRYPICRVHVLRLEHSSRQKRGIRLWQVTSVADSSFCILFHVVVFQVFIFATRGGLTNRRNRHMPGSHDDIPEHILCVD